MHHGEIATYTAADFLAAAPQHWITFLATGFPSMLSYVYHHADVI
uniref:Uncharacterized protein n=1 Tax=Arundo donax TaxID=35708 RepID=A0A0A9FB47_ARUDO